eukprot:scaffold4725_cov367-Prasinococcus_capsulatus_cf.AAC.3
MQVRIVAPRGEDKAGRLRTFLEENAVDLDKAVSFDPTHLTTPTCPRCEPLAPASRSPPALGYSA